MGEHDMEPKRESKTEDQSFNKVEQWLAGGSKPPDKRAKKARPEPNFKFSDTQIASGEAKKLVEALEAAGQANKLAQAAAATARASVHSSRRQSSADRITIDDSTCQNWLRRAKSDSDDLPRLHETFTNMLGTFTSLTIAPPSPAAGEATSNSSQGNDNPGTVSNEGPPSFNSLPESLGGGWSFIQNQLLSTSSDDMASSMASTSPLRSLPSQPHTARWALDNEPESQPSRSYTLIERSSPLPDSRWVSKEKNSKIYTF